MSRYIAVDELNLAKFHPLPYTHITPADIKDVEAYERGWNDAIDAIIENAPNTDVVKLVQCRECKYKDEGQGYCYKHGIWLHRMTFCSDGERREDGEEIR